MACVPPRGVYTPLTLFFDSNQAIDYSTFREHILRVVHAGVTGLVISGSNGEAVHLTRSERSEVLKFARSVLDTSGFLHVPIIAGCGAASVRETIEYCKDASAAGAVWSLVLPPAYWVSAMTKVVLKEFYEDVAAQSPIPIILYNFPAVTGGLDLDSDLISSLSETPNIVGAKLTCCNMGKIQRLASVGGNSGLSPGFCCLVGKSEAFLPGLVAGADGLIGALTNLFPTVHVHLLRGYDVGNWDTARDIQAKLSRADWLLMNLGVSGLKAAIQRYYGYGSGRSRRPLQSMTKGAWATVDTTVLDELVLLERNLSRVKL